MPKNLAQLRGFTGGTNLVLTGAACGGLGFYRSVVRSRKRKRKISVCNCYIFDAFIDIWKESISNHMISTRLINQYHAKILKLIFSQKMSFRSKLFTSLSQPNLNYVKNSFTNINKPLVVSSKS